MKKMIFLIGLGCIAGFCGVRIVGAAGHYIHEKQREAKCIEDQGKYFQGECYAPEYLADRLTEFLRTPAGEAWVHAVNAEAAQ